MYVKPPDIRIFAQFFIIVKLYFQIAVTIRDGRLFILTLNIDVTNTVKSMELKFEYGKFLVDFRILNFSNGRSFVSFRPLKLKS